MGQDEILEKCREHVNSLLDSSHHSGLKETSYPSTSLNFLRRSERQGGEPAQAKVKIKIVIVGAGLGGLAAAIALRRRGHAVTVFERAPELGEVGAGIQVPPNSSRLLLKWGLGPYLEGKAIEPTAINMRRWQSGEIIGLTKLIPEFRIRFAAPFYVVHRANLQLAMHRLALDLGGIEVKVNSGVKAYDPENGTVLLDNGKVEQADLVVAADGIKSEARKIVLDGEDQLPQRAGFAAYRAMVDTNLMKADPDVSWLLDNPCQNLWIGNQRHVMTYSVAGGKSFNLVLSHPEDTDPSTWKQETAVQDMKRHFRGWDPRLLKVVDMIQDTLKWPLLTGKPLQKWVSSGRLVIIGDAAHPMVPYMSEGAAMAIEDGAALAEILSLISSTTELKSALKVWEQLRILRSGQMQEASLVNGKLWHFDDGPEQKARDAAMRAEVEGRPFEESPNQWSDPMTQRWAYAYDAEKEISDAWRLHCAASSKL